jgi:phage-related minor tail protein
MLVPTQEFLNDLPRIAKAYWAHRLERITNERRRLSTVLQDVKTLNQKILLQKVNGELLPEDFALLKETVTQQTTEAETQMTSLDTETATMGRLMEDKQREIVDVVGMWRNGGVQQRQELALSLYPESLRFSL